MRGGGGRERERNKQLMLTDKEDDILDTLSKGSDDYVVAAILRLFHELAETGMIDLDDDDANMLSLSNKNNKKRTLEESASSDSTTTKNRTAEFYVRVFILFEQRVANMRQQSNQSPELIEKLEATRKELAQAIHRIII